MTNIDVVPLFVTSSVRTSSLQEKNIQRVHNIETLALILTWADMKIQGHHIMERTYPKTDSSYSLMLPRIMIVTS